MIFEMEFLTETYTSGGLEGSLEERTRLDYPLGGRVPLLAGWEIVCFNNVDPSLPTPDFFTVYQGGIVGVMPRVLNDLQLKSQFMATGELLPVKLGTEDAYLFHPLEDLDALDKKRSKFWKLSNGHVICKNAVFKSSFQTPHWFFRVSGSRRLFTTSGFVEYYQKQGFTGLEFHPQPMSEA